MRFTNAFGSRLFAQGLYANIFSTQTGSEEYMGNKFSKVSDKETLEKLLTISRDRPVLVFKHSNACAISSRAYREMEQLEDVNLLEVQSARELSNRLAELTGVEHETPQVIVLRDGRAVWNASHYDVNVAAVTKALQSIS